MALTRIQPSGIDQTLDYSVDQLTANTVVVSGVNILNSANAANNLAQAAFNAANTGTVASAAFTQANTSLDLANAAFNAANTGTVASAAFTQANTSLVLANAAFTKANTGGASGLIYKSSNTTPSTANVGDQWYSVTEDILYQYINDGTSNAWVDISSSAVTTNPGVGGGSGTNNARSIINSYVFGY